MMNLNNVKRGIMISDLDGTITNKSLVLEHYGHLIKKGIVADNGSYSAWVEDMKNEKLIVQCAMSYQKAITGKRLQELDINNFIEEFINGNNWHEEVLEMLVRSAESKEVDVVLITGSADFLVQPLCEKFGFDCFATIYQRDLKEDRLTGEVVGMFAENQKDDCIKNNIDLHLYNEVIGLGDTASDYGIFKHCQKNYLVQPTKETLEKLIVKGARIEKIFK